MRAHTLPSPTPAERALARLIGPAAESNWKSFANGEDHVRAGGVERDVCVIGRTLPPGDNVFRTLLLIDTLRRSGAERITVLLPYFAYSRQDRQQLPGEAVTSLAIIKAFAAAGAGRIVTADLHSSAVAEESPIPVESVSVVAEFAAALRRRIGDTPCTVVAPDHGARHRADLMAAGLGQRQEAAWIGKVRHPVSGKIAAKEVSGQVQGKTAVLVDDILDTGKTIELAARLLRRRGFTDLHLCVTHGLFTGDAAARIRRLRFKTIMVSDTVPVPKSAARLSGLKVVPVGKKLAAAALR